MQLTCIESRFVNIYYTVDGIEEIKLFISLCQKHLKMLVAGVSVIIHYSYGLMVFMLN